MKEPFEIEVLLQVSPKLLYKFISTEEGLTKWFADKVNINKDKIEFFWSKTKHEAIIISQKEPKYFKFCWIEDYNNANNYYVEMNILPTNQDNFTLFKIKDFSEADEKEANILLWETHIEQLKRSLGILRN